jgi:hypothetical protein
MSLNYFLLILFAFVTEGMAASTELAVAGMRVWASNEVTYHNFKIKDLDFPQIQHPSHFGNPIQLENPRKFLKSIRITKINVLISCSSGTCRQLIPLLNPIKFIFCCAISTSRTICESQLLLSGCVDVAYFI